MTSPSTHTPPPALRRHPSKLFVEMTTRCNLGCFMCVKQAAGCAIAEGDMSAATFYALEPAFPHLEALVLNGIGEPLLHPRLEEFVRTAKRLMPAHGWVGFQSNGLLLTNLKAIALVEAGLDRICLSVDAASPETFRTVRTGAEMYAIDQAFAALAAAKDRCQRRDVQVGMEFVLMRSNLGELATALRWAAAQGASFAIVTHALPYDEQHAREALYDTCTDKAIALFDATRAEAERQGLDIHRYFGARWKYARSPDEQRLADLVKKMKAEADRRGIFLDMKKLLRLDTTLRARIDEVFAEAREVARQTGLDLKLPGIALKKERHCDFVEDGGAFVTWDGKVSPCYFLWHSYSCFASGWQQQVQPKVFGSVTERGILEIWNAQDFCAFRETVLAYDYPDCASCTLAPCDYVQADEFEQDCHIRDVRCGACLWCAGVFQCLR